MFDAILLAAHSLSEFSQIYPIQTNIDSTKCSSTTYNHQPLPFRYGQKLIAFIRKTVSKYF